MLTWRVNVETRMYPSQNGCVCVCVCVCFHHPHHFKSEHARVERVYEELGSLEILVAVATFQTVLSSDLGSRGE